MERTIRKYMIYSRMCQSMCSFEASACALFTCAPNTKARMPNQMENHAKTVPLLTGREAMSNEFSAEFFQFTNHPSIISVHEPCTEATTYIASLSIEYKESLYLLILYILFPLQNCLLTFAYPYEVDLVLSAPCRFCNCVSCIRS